MDERWDVDVDRIRSCNTSRVSFGQTRKGKGKGRAGRTAVGKRRTMDRG
jgi:hypothetical protein